jgi:hypothetical protein
MRRGIERIPELKPSDLDDRYARQLEQEFASDPSDSPYETPQKREPSAPTPPDDSIQHEDDVQTD